jgi:CP family cyanate transporter-like MFS transporter
MIAQPALVRGRVLTFVGIALAALGLRSAATAVSPILRSIEVSVSFQPGDLTLLGMFAPLAFAIFGAITPAISRRIGLEGVMIIALLVLGGGEIARALTDTPATFLAFSFVSMAGTGSVNVLLPPMVKKYFGNRIPTMSVVYLFLAVLSSVIPPYLASPLASLADWRVSISAWGYIALVAALPWLAVMIRNRGGRGEPASTVTDPDVTKRVWRSPAAWAITVAFGIAAFNCYTMWQWMPTMLHERAHLDETSGGLMLAIYSAVALPNSIIGTMIVARAKSMVWPSLYGMVVLIIGALGFWFVPTTLPWLWVIFSGLGVIFFTIGLVLINLRTSTQAGAVALSGMVQGVGYLIGAVGPLLVGLAHGASGNSDIDFVIIIGSALVGIFPLIVLRKKAMVDAPRPLK